MNLSLPASVKNADLSWLFPQPPSAAAESITLDHGLKAQGRMVPYALGFFGVGLPIFLWAARVSLTSWHMAFYLLLFTIGWTAFFVLRSQVERRVTGDPALDQATTSARFWRQGLAAALWTAILLAISFTAKDAGAPAETLLMLCAGAAVGIVFFCSPVLIYLLILGPVAVAGPVIALHMIHDRSDVGELMSGGVILALALGFVLNRQMQERYLLEERQRDLAREREAARAASDALNDARMALMETLSREIQTGLKNVEQNLLQALTHLTRAPAPRQYVDTALGQVGHLQSILVTTLDSDTAEAGQIELDMQPLDIELLCQKMMTQFAALAHSKDLQLTCNLQGLPHSGAALGDEHRVEQILAHLLSNALLYTQQGRVELKLMLLSDGFVRIEVVDSGPGLGEEELEQAFLPHVRILRTSSGHSGAGLGLSLSRSLSGLMGGRMGAQSTLDVGSKFWLDLPFDTEASPPPRPVDPEVETDALSDHSLRVLLLANDSLRAAQLRDVLERLGHKCLTSTTRERALALARKAPIDACLISTGTFESLDDADNLRDLNAFFDGLRATQTDARLNILALLPEGGQVEDLQALGVKPLLLPQNRESLGRALAQ